MTSLVLLMALSHIKLSSPQSTMVQNTLGDPQKTAPCGGNGTATNAVTTVEAGSQLEVQWTETIGHPGHFRIGIARDVSEFVTPTAVVMNNDCKSAPIEANPSYPTLVDGLFVHTNSPSNVQRTTTITVPMMSCENCTLQLLQFMSNHVPGCFYFQCATLRIVMPDAGVPVEMDAGVIEVDAGVADAGTTGDAGVEEEEHHHHHEEEPMPEPMGCGCNSLAMMPWALGLLFLPRRRKHTPPH
ncbi:MAG: SCE4755 family polysaccharide monooxygenase-like protein [Archangium sp.]